MISRLFSSKRPAEIESRDHLCYNPLILQILSHLDYKDISRCKLVNRQLNRIINNNFRNLARPHSKFVIKTLAGKSSGEFSREIVDVTAHDCSNRECHLIITNSSLVIMADQTNLISHYYRMHGDRVWFKPFQSPDDKQLWEFITQKGTSYAYGRRDQLDLRFDLFRAAEYRINSLFECLCTITSIIGRHYELNHLCLLSSYPIFDVADNANLHSILLPKDQLIGMLNTLLETTTCRYLSSFRWFPEMASFATRLCCRWLNTTISDLSEVLTSLNTDSMFVEVHIKECDNLLVPLCAFLKEWESGYRNIQFFDVHVYDSPIRNIELLAALKQHLQCISVKENGQSGQYPEIVIHIRRPIDIQMLGLKYDRRGIRGMQCTFNEVENITRQIAYGQHEDYYEWCTKTRTYRRRPEFS